MREWFKEHSVCATVAFKIVLALSLVDRRKLMTHPTGGHVLQHRQPGYQSVLFREYPEVRLLLRSVPCRLLRRITTREEWTGTRGAALGFAYLWKCAMSTAECMGGHACVESAAVHCCGSLTCTVFTRCEF